MPFPLLAKDPQRADTRSGGKSYTRLPALLTHSGPARSGSVSTPHSENSPTRVDASTLRTSQRLSSGSPRRHISSDQGRSRIIVILLCFRPRNLVFFPSSTRRMETSATRWRYSLHPSMLSFKTRCMQRRQIRALAASGDPGTRVPRSRSCHLPL